MKAHASSTLSLAMAELRSEATSEISELVATLAAVETGVRLR